MYLFSELFGYLCLNYFVHAICVYDCMDITGWVDDDDATACWCSFFYNLWLRRSLRVLWLSLSCHVKINFRNIVIYCCSCYHFYCECTRVALILQDFRCFQGLKTLTNILLDVLGRSRNFFFGKNFKK